MAFIKKTKKGFLEVDDSEWGEKKLLDYFKTMIEKEGFDDFKVSCGVNPSPDFGYLELADRFWRTSLSIYFTGVSGCFWERGAGYSEPWLFNARHSIELYLKGFFLYAVWFQEVQENVVSSGHRIYLQDIRKYFEEPHNLLELYGNYQKKIKDVIQNWNTAELSSPPETNKMLLSAEGEDFLKELDEADKSSFRFRYPSVRSNKKDHLQELNWRYDDAQLFPKTGLPKNAGYFFDHMTVINSLHKLRKEMKEIDTYLGGCWDYIGEYQDIILHEMQEFYGENS